MGYTIDIDTGGTFTDGFFARGERVETAKVPTTPHDLTVCFMDCVKAGAARFGVSLEDLLHETEIIRFSNTIGTNTLIQRDGTKVGLLVTAGQEQLAPTRAEGDLAPLVGEDMIIGLPEAVSSSGQVQTVPDEQQALEAAQLLIDRGARCLVVAFGNSERNPANERLVRDLIKREYPRDYLGSVPVFLASNISVRSGDAERMNAAVINAYIHAKLVRLLYKAGEDLRQHLYHRSLFIGHSNGAVARVAKTRAINTYNSGPAAGLLGARLIADLYQADALITADMGGTSFDLGYVRGGQASYSLNPQVEGFPVNVPMHAIRAIGAGGGSIASVKDGELRVGPQSAGALPGPVCFDLGGTQPTVTDADLVLGVLDLDNFLGGTMKLNREKAVAVLEEKLARPLGISVDEAAHEVKRIVDESMGREVRALRDEMGDSLHPFLVVYGGAGPAHCCSLARVAGLSRIVITPFSAVFSAFGSSTLDVGHLYYRRVDAPLTEGDTAGLQAAVAALHTEAERDLRGEGFAQEWSVRGLELFVQNGGPEVRLNLETSLLPDSLDVAAAVAEARRVLGGGGDSIITAVGLRAQAPVPHFALATSPVDPQAPTPQPRATRAVYLQGSRSDLPVYILAELASGQGITGPALVESPDTTLLVESGWQLAIDTYGNCLLEEVLGR